MRVVVMRLASSRIHEGYFQLFVLPEMRPQLDRCIQTVLINAFIRTLYDLAGISLHLCPGHDNSAVILETHRPTFIMALLGP